MSSEPMDSQSSPIIEDKSSNKTKRPSSNQSNTRLDWWDLLPLVQEPQHTPAIHWTPRGIITAHPTKPILLLYPIPPSTAERKIYPSDRRISESDSFGSARVLSVSECGTYVFAYFPVANGSNSGAWCIWVNMLLRQFWTVEQGAAVVDCWWLGNPRQRVIGESGCSLRLPQMGPRIAFHSPVALLLSENFTLQLVCEPSMSPQHDGPLHITTASALRATANSSPRTSTALDQYTGFICTRAAMGLAYSGSDSSIIIGMQAALLPPPCLPLSDVQSLGLPVPSATLLTHANVDDWEYTGTEPMVRLCEVVVSYTNKRGWNIRTDPILSIPIPPSSHLSHLHVIPKSPDIETNMVVDGGDTCPSRYIAIGTVEFGTYSSLPETSFRVYSLRRDARSTESLKSWDTQLEATRIFDGCATLSLSTAHPSYGRQTGLLVSITGLSGSPKQDPSNKVQMLHIPSLQNDDTYATVTLQQSSHAPSALAISPLGTHMVLQSLKNSKEFGYYAYPTREHGTKSSKWQEQLMHSLLSQQDTRNIHKLNTGSSPETQLDLVDSVWDMLDSESSGGGPARWSMQYLQELLVISSTSSDTTMQEEAWHKTRAVTLDFLSLPVAKGALVECHSKDAEGPYDTDCIWPLSEICGWVVEFSESVLSAAGEHANVVREEDMPPEANHNIDRRLLILLHSALLNAWIEALTLVTQFLKHVDGPKGSSSDNKTLVTKAVEDAVEQSPINLSSLIEALKTLATRQFPTLAEWRKAYRTSQLSGSGAQLMASAVEPLVVPEVVSLLPLHVRMAGLNLLHSDDARQERDIITKKPLVQNELRTLGYRIRASCSQCHGKTMIDLSTPLSTSRWQRWEGSFQRCICGGRWKLSA